MKNFKVLLTFFSIVSVILACSKGNERLSRDLLSPLTPVPFELTASTGSSTNKNLTTFQKRMNLDSLIKANAGPSFGTADIQSIKLTSMRLDVLNFDTVYNFRLIDSLQVKLLNGPDTTAILAQVISNPDVNSETLILPLAGDQPELRDFVGGGSFNYVLSGHIRRNTALPLKATLTAQYTITIGK